MIVTNSLPYLFYKSLEMQEQKSSWMKASKKKCEFQIATLHPYLRTTKHYAHYLCIQLKQQINPNPNEESVINTQYSISN